MSLARIITFLTQLDRICKEIRRNYDTTHGNIQQLQSVANNRFISRIENVNLPASFRNVTTLVKQRVHAISEATVLYLKFNLIAKKSLK